MCDDSTPRSRGHPEPPPDPYQPNKDGNRPADEANGLKTASFFLKVIIFGRRVLQVVVFRREKDKRPWYFYGTMTVLGLAIILTTAIGSSAGQKLMDVFWRLMELLS
ncbi:MAG: hypothetical protein HQ592_10250 [Planctomycetes bacterium]|nr:hypothetical protein [Planctomycetota bacterium]